MRASIIAGGDAAPFLDPAEVVFDLVALAVEFLVVVVLDFAVLAWRDARCDAAPGQAGPELALLWQKCNFGDSLGGKCVIHGEPALMEAGCGDGVAERS